MDPIDNVRIVLVEPEHPGNIGATARAMKTMGVKSLHLVNPARFPDPQADWRAAGALDIVAEAVIHDELDDALIDCGYIVGTTARDRHVPWPTLTAEEFGAKVRKGFGTDLPLAILFGRETNGLTNQELLRCNSHVRIPSNPEYGSLNLAMAVQIVTYEIFKSSLDGEFFEQRWDRQLASSTEIDQMVRHLEQICDLVGFFSPGAPRHAMVRFRRLFNRIELDETEIKLLRGLFSHIEQKNPSMEESTESSRIRY